MGLEEKTQFARDNGKEERDRQALYCFANFLPGKAFERWWVYGLVSDNDRRANYRHTFGSRFDYDGRFPVPNYKTLRKQRASLQLLQMRGVYLKLLNWGTHKNAHLHHTYIDWRSWRGPSREQNASGHLPRH